MIQKKLSALQGTFREKWQDPEILGTFRLSMMATFALGLIAHAYIFFQDTFSHDSLNAMYADAAENLWKIKLGRFLKPLYQTLTRGDIALPWLIGVMSLLWAGLAVFLIVRMFDISAKSKATIVAIAGIIVTNMTVIATAATYIYDLDTNMFALLAATLAVYLWNRNRHKWLAIPLITVTLGLYQSYVSVAIVLMMLICIMDLLESADFWMTIKKGCSGILVLIAGGGLYWLLLKGCQGVMNISFDTGTYNSVDLMSQMNGIRLLKGIAKAYVFWMIHMIQGAAYRYPLACSFGAHAVLLICYFVMFCQMAKANAVALKEKLLIMVLVLLLPLAMNISSVLSGGLVHYVMSYAVWLSYLLLVLMAQRRMVMSAEHGSERSLKIVGICTYLIIFMILLGNAQVSNTVYLRKDLEDDATLSMMTRIVYSLEERDDYLAAETPVAFIGKSVQTKVSPGFEKYSSLTGMGGYGNAARRERSIAASFYPFEKYIRTKLGIPMVICDDETWLILKDSEAVGAMPAFPAAGSIQKFDDVIVVKLGN